VLAACRAIQGDAIIAIPRIPTAAIHALIEPSAVSFVLSRDASYPCF
jgi:hypothetical protein